MRPILALLGFDKTQHSIRTEVVAGVTTFLTMAYILAVNPSIFSALESEGMPVSAQFTATALAAAFGSLLVAVIAKQPYGLAPGMGLNAFFVYTVCLKMHFSWQTALTAVFIEGLIFVVLSATHVRELLVRAIPRNLKLAISVGIGLYLAFIGMQNAGFVVANSSTLITMGDVTDKTVLLSVIGFIIMAGLMIWRVPGGILLGIVVTTLIGIPMGVTHLHGVVSTPSSVAPLLCQFQWNELLSLNMVICVFTFLFLDIFDTMGTVVGVSVRNGKVDDQGNIQGVSHVFMSDALATVAGACFGTSTTTIYMESTTGISAGGKTGLTALTISALFVASLFLGPLFGAIPAAATAPALILIGLTMCAPMHNLEWSDITEGVPAFITLICMPLCYSISDGIMLGVLSYVALNTIAGKAKKVNATMWVLATLFCLRYIFL